MQDGNGWTPAPDVARRGASQSVGVRLGGPGEELPCSLVSLAPIESLAKSSLDRVRCGALLGLGGSAPQVKKSCAGRRKNRVSTTLQATSWHLGSDLLGGLGGTGPRNGGGYGVPSIRGGR